MANTRGRPPKKNEILEVFTAKGIIEDYSEDQKLFKDIGDTTSEKTMEEPSASKMKSKERIQLDLNMRVKITSGYHGKLVIKFPKDSYSIVLEKFGDFDYVELGNLNALRNSSPRFFSENWILIDDIDVIKFIHTEQFYKKALSFDELETFFDLDIEEMMEKIADLSEAQKKLVAYMAMDKMDNGTLDSMKIVKGLEEALGCQLSEE